MIRLALAFALVATPALAQQNQTPIEQALSQRVMVEINNNLSCNAKLLEVQKQLEVAEAKLKQTESKGQ